MREQAAQSIQNITANAMQTELKDLHGPKPLLQQDTINELREGRNRREENEEEVQDIALQFVLTN